MKHQEREKQKAEEEAEKERGERSVGGTFRPRQIVLAYSSLGYNCKTASANEVQMGANAVCMSAATSFHTQLVFMSAKIWLNLGGESKKDPVL